MVTALVPLVLLAGVIVLWWVGKRRVDAIRRRGSNLNPQDDPDRSEDRIKLWRGNS